MGMCYFVTIVRRELGELFQHYLLSQGLQTQWALPCEGTAQQRTLDLLGIEKTGKVMLSAVTAASKAQRLLKGVVREMRIDVPGNGIAFTIPLRSVGGTSSLQYLTAGQDSVETEVISMEENRFSLIIVIANKGHTDPVMDAAREAGAKGGTIVHAKGAGEKLNATFFGMSIASEQELIYIVTRQESERTIMRSILDKAGPRQGHISAVFSLPVRDVVGLRSLTEEA